jgi:hypothetical protein
MFVVHLIISFCSKRALRYDQCLNMYSNLEGIDYIYSSGLMIHKRDKWLNIVKWLQIATKRG